MVLGELSKYQVAIKKENGLITDLSRDYMLLSEVLLLLALKKMDQMFTVSEPALGERYGEPHCWAGFLHYLLAVSFVEISVFPQSHRGTARNPRTSLPHFCDAGETISYDFVDIRHEHLAALGREAPSPF